MNIREEIDRLKSGELTQEQQARLLAEIERHEAIGEYLALRFEQEFAPPETDLPIDPSRESKRIVRRIKFRLMSYVLLALAVVAASVLLWIGYCDRAFYNPNEGIGQTYGGDGQFMIDMTAFTELHSPGYTVSMADASRDGPGSYALRIRQNELFSGKELTTTERLVRGELLSAGENSSREYWRFPYANAFGYRRGIQVWVDENGMEHRSPSPEQIASLKEALAELPPSGQASVYVTLPQDQTLDQFVGFWQRCQDSGLYPSYAAVVTNEGYLSDVLGFEPFGAGLVLPNVPDETRYPYFELGGRMVELQGDYAAVWEAHFRSLLTYLSERPEFLEAMADVNGIGPSTYRDALSYLDQNGMKIYGALVQGNAAQILQMIEQEGIVEIYVADVKLSVLSH